MTTGLPRGTAALLLDIQLGLVGAAAAWGPRPWASWKRIMGMPCGSSHRGALATGPPRTLTHTRMHTRGIPYANMKCSCLARQSPLEAKQFFRPVMARSTRRAILGLSANGYTPIALSVRKLAPLSNDCYDYQIASFVL